MFTGFLSSEPQTFTFRYHELNGLEINRRLIGPRKRSYGSRQIYCEVAACGIGADQFQLAVMRFGNPQGYRQPQTRPALAPRTRSRGISPEESLENS
jgi:hypothetical protein